MAAGEGLGVGFAEAPAGEMARPGVLPAQGFDFRLPGLLNGGGVGVLPGDTGLLRPFWQQGVEGRRPQGGGLRGVPQGLALGALVPLDLPALGRERLREVGAVPAQPVEVAPAADGLAVRLRHGPGAERPAAVSKRPGAASLPPKTPQPESASRAKVRRNAAHRLMLPSFPRSKAPARSEKITGPSKGTGR